MTHKEMTAHIRNRLKAHKVKARVKMNEACGVKYITVVVPSYGFVWSYEEAKEIAICAHVNKLTMARGSAIDIELLANKLSTGLGQVNFEFHEAL